MTCSTLSTSTAYCSTDRQLRSVCTTTLATLRCTNTSPGMRPMISLAGTRLSAQPIHRYLGDCCSARRLKKSGWARLMPSAQARLLAKSSGSFFMVFPVRRPRPSLVGRSPCRVAEGIEEGRDPGVLCECPVYGVGPGRGSGARQYRRAHAAVLGPLRPQHGHLAV